jgi:uncharacterized protein (DUF302 family)
MPIQSVLSFLAGVVVTLVGVVFFARSSMITVEPSALGFEETVQAIEAGIEAAEGWSSPGTRDLNGMMAKHGVTFEPRVRLVEMCKAPYAAEVLRDDRRVATLMPCATAVWEDDAGRVFISKMNLDVMGRVFGGTVGRVMGGSVAKEEEEILRAVR